MRIHLQLLSLKQVKVQDDMHEVFPCLQARKNELFRAYKHGKTHGKALEY